MVISHEVKVMADKILVSVNSVRLCVCLLAMAWHDLWRQLLLRVGIAEQIIKNPLPTESWHLTQHMYTHTHTHTHICMLITSYLIH